MFLTRRSYLNPKLRNHAKAAPTLLLNPKPRILRPRPRNAAATDGPLIDSATIDRHLAELASDKYGGRLP